MNLNLKAQQHSFKKT